MKRIALLMALLMLVFCVVACSQEKTDPVGSNPANETQTPTTSTQTENAVAATITLCDHEYGKGVVEQDPACVESGIRLLTCTKCGESVSQEIPAFGHRGSGASCTEPSFCTLCAELVEPAWGHNDQDGICRNCGMDLTGASAGTAQPESTEPEQTEPEQTEPVQTEPEQTEPVQTEPASEETEPAAEE